MREIKFSIWDIDNKKMLVNCLRLTNEGEVRWIQLSRTSENLIWLQYTGLKDKNGKEIYEEDIVKWEKNKHRDACGVALNEIKISSIEWGDCGWLPFEYNDGYDTVIMFEVEDCEVIGNIYENPTLLDD